ncbi:MAG: helix-turn-helix transcriptional regulator [Chitinophagaceae bacterium]|jgi:transcriptional regulator with XRE-family HTH domain
MPQPINNEQKEELIKLGERVRTVRQNKGLSLQDVADKIGKDRQSIQRLEKGGFNPSYIYLLEVCKGLEVEIKEIF